MIFPDATIQTDLANGGTYFEVDEEEMEWNARFRPVVVVVDAPYAPYIEYGTGPAKHGSNMSKEYLQRLQDWVERKFGKKDNDAKLLAYSIGKKIHDEGISAQPFARPAMEDLIWDIDNGRFDFDDPTLTSRVLADVLVARMRYYLSQPKGDADLRKYPTNTTGFLSEHIFVEDAPLDATATISINIIESMDDIEVRDSSTLGFHENREYRDTSIYD